MLHHIIVKWNANVDKEAAAQKVHLLYAAAAKNAGNSSDTITLVWYPNESAEDYQAARDEVGKLIEKATGKKWSRSCRIM